MRRLKFEIVETGAPAPHECWWKIRAANGRILFHSEIMNKRNAHKVIKQVIDAIQTKAFTIVEVPPPYSHLYPKIKKI